MHKSAGRTNSSKETTAAELCQHALDVVVVPDRDATRRDHGVASCRPLQVLLDHLGAVGGNAEVDRLATRGRDGGLQAVAVRARDPAVVGEPIGLDDLVARGQDRDARAARHARRGPAQGGQHAQVRGTQQRARAGDDLPCDDVGARAADVVAGPHGAEHPEGIPLPLRLLLHDDRIGPVRDRGPRQDPGGLPGPEAARAPPPGRDLLHHLERGGQRGHVGRPQRKAVHGRVVEGRDGARRRHLLLEHAPERLSQRDAFGAERPDRAENDRARLPHLDRGPARSTVRLAHHDSRS
jgi:hypothetical protein